MFFCSILLDISIMYFCFCYFVRLNCISEGNTAHFTSLSLFDSGSTLQINISYDQLIKYDALLKIKLANNGLI